jgi:manganese/iron transport system permease protein
MSIWTTILLAAMLGGASAGALGIWITGLRMPFLAIFTAHAALAGAAFGPLLELDATLAGFAGALAGASLLGWLLRKRDLDPNAALGSLFSFTLGVAFLGIGLAPEGRKADILQLLWGSLLLVSPAHVARMAVAAVVLAAFAILFHKELKLLLYSRSLAATSVPAGPIFAALLVIGALVITVNLEAVGGLLLYSLIVNPAVAALRFARSYPAALAGGAGLGALCALGGFGVAWLLNWPVGACIVLFSSLVVAVASLAARSKGAPAAVRTETP